MSSPQQQMTASGPLLFSQRQPLPKQLTAAIKSCTSLERLSQLFAAHQAVLNPIHIAAMITKLPKLDTSAHNPSPAAGSSDMPWNLATGQVQQLQLRQLLQQLLLRLKAQGCGEYSPRGVANIVWALAKLQCAPDPDLRCMLLDKFCSQLPTAVPQDISNVLWGVAKITKERSAAAGGTAAVLQPLGLAAAGSLSSPSSSTSGPSLAGSAISAQSWGLVGGPGSLPSLHGSGSYDAGLAAAAAVPLLAQDQVRLLLQHLCQQLHTASVQTISNSLWAVVVLQQEHQWCMCNCLGEVQQLLSSFCRQPHQALPGHIQPVIRCMAQLATTCSNHAGSSWISWQPPLLQQLLQYLGSQKETMELHHVSSVLRDVAQVVCLHLLRAKQLRDQQQQACGVQPSSAAADGSSTRSGHMQLNTISGEAEGEEVLARLAASGGPQDTSSTIVALAMLQPQLEQLGLQQGVAALCSMLPPAALPHLGEEASQRLLAATSTAAAAAAAAAAASQSPAAAAAPAATPSAAAVAAQHLQLVLPEQQGQQAAGMPPASIVTPSAAAGSSSASNSSGSNVVISGNEGSSSTSTSAATAPAAPAAAAAAPAAPPGFTALEGLMLPDDAEAEAAAGAAAASSSTTPVAEGRRSSNMGSVEQQQVGGSESQDSQQQQQQQQQSPAKAPSSPAAAAAAVASPQQQQLLQPQPHQLQGLASAPASASTSAEPLPLAAGASDAAGTDASAGLAVDKEEAAARQLTHNIANADSVYQLAEIFSAHSSVMDMIHITACITRLSKVLGTAPSASSQAAASSLLPLLGSKLMQVLPNANARGIANILWGYGRLRNLPQSELLPELLRAFLQQLPTAACRDSAVVLWSLARLTEGQGVAAVGVSTDLLSQLGKAVMEQLSAAATAAMEGTGGQQQQQQQQPPPPPPPPPPPTAAQQQQQQQQGAEDAAGKHDHRDSGEASAPPSSRDISNSLMALTRLGFTPESEPAAAAAAAAADKAPAAAAAAAGQPAAPQSPAAAAAATAAAKDQASAAAAAMQDLSLQATEAAAAADQAQPAVTQEPAAAAAVDSTSQSAEQQHKPLSLPLAPIKAVVQFLLRHAASAKTLDLQEAATALKQLGLQELSGQVAAGIGSPSGPGQHGGYDPASHHHSMGMGPGPMQYGHGGGMQYYHHHMAGPGMSQGYGSASRPGGHMYGGPGLTGRPGSGSFGGPAGPGSAYGSSATSAVLARTHSGQPAQYQGQQQQQQQQAGSSHLPPVSMPATINLSGTQLAGLLQQQRRQQPLPMSGPAYGAGWLPGKGSQQDQQQQQQQHPQRQGSGPGSSGAACLVPGLDGSGMMSQQQQQSYRMYMPGGSSGSGSPGMRRVSGGGHQGMSYAADASAAGGFMSSTGRGMHLQYQQRQQQQQQEQWGQGQSVRRLSGPQQTEVMHQQQLQQHSYGIAGGQQQGGVQYVFVPQQYNVQQQQQQPGTYMVPQQGLQPPPPADTGMMMQQVLQQQSVAVQQPQQQAVAGQQQMVMVPVSMAAALYNMGQPVSSLPGQQQQQQQGLAAPGVAMQVQQPTGGESWITQGQSFAAAGQQQQQSQQLMQMLPQIQAAATAAGGGALPGQFAVQAGGAVAGSAVGAMPYQVSAGMMVGSTEYVVPVESEVLVSGQMPQVISGGQIASTDYAGLGLATPAQQQQVYSAMPGGTGMMQQQQGVRVGLEPPGLYMQQQQPQQDAMQLMYGVSQQGMSIPQQPQQPGGVIMAPGGGYTFQGGQYQQQ
jgi:hypothetical protein